MKKGLFHKLPILAVAALAAASMLPSLANGSGTEARTRGTKAVQPATEATSPATEATPTPPADTTATPSRQLSRNESRRYSQFFLEAVRQQNAEHFDAAFQLYTHCIQINPSAAESWYALSAYYASMGKDSLSLSCLERAATLAPSNDTYQERVAQSYIGTKDYDRAIEAYESLYSHHRDRSDVLSILTQLYRQKRDYRQMLATIDRMEQVEGPSDELTLAKMNVYELMGDSQNAHAMLQHLVDIHPDEPTYKVMLGNWLLKHDGQPEALKLFTAALDDDPQNETAQSSMYDYYRSVGNDSAAIALRERMLLSQKTEQKTKITMLQQAIRECEQQQGDSTEVLALFRRVMAADTANTDIAELRIAYMQLKQMPKDTIEAALRGILSVEPDNASARFQLIQLIWPRQNWTEIISLCKSATQYNPEEMAFYYFMGLSYYQLGSDRLALDAFRRGVGEIRADSDPGIVSDFYSMMGDILYRLDDQKAAFAAYDSCLVWKSDNVACLNNYAYYLSELGRDLPRAERMSRQAIKQEPTNATYLDTYAWILFLQGDTTNAHTYIDQAVACDTDSVPSAVILEHAGDIHAVCGDTSEAVLLWQRALEAGGEKAILNKKIKRRRYVK